MSFLDKFEYGSMSVIAIFVIILGFSNGIYVRSITFDLYFIAGRIAVLDAVYSAASFTLFILLGSLLLSKNIFSRSEIPVETSGKEVAALVPVYQDSKALVNTISSLNESNYRDLTSYVICEPGDTKSIETAESLDCRVLINQHPGSKSGAINTAFEELEQEYFAIFDADEYIKSSFIPRAIGYLEEGYEAFQGRRIPISGGLIENLAYCERSLYHASVQLMELIGFCYVKSSSTVLKRQAWEKVSGYDDMITEDIDFIHKCHRNNIKAKCDRRVTNRMEAPHSWKDFWGQRKRWSKGLIEVMHKSLKGGYNVNKSYGGISSTLRSIVGVLAPIYAIGLVSKIVLLIIFDLEIGFMVPIVISAVPTLIFSYKDRNEVKLVGFYSFMTFFTLIITGLLRIKGILEYVLSENKEWYQVDKTGNLD